MAPQPKSLFSDDDDEPTVTGDETKPHTSRSVAPARSASSAVRSTVPRRRDGGPQDSAFDSAEKTKSDARRGRAVGVSGFGLQPVRKPLTADEMKAVAGRIDGSVVASPVTKSAWDLRPIDPEVASTPGTRDPLLSRVVIDQFSPQINPRYSEREAGHIFVWDFANAMGCKVPRYRAQGELSLEQVCAWFRTLGADAGWIKIAGARAVELASRGAPVIALPRNPRTMLMAVVRPDAQGTDGAPLLASACKRRRGNKLTVLEAFGERQADYYFHE